MITVDPIMNEINNNEIVRRIMDAQDPLFGYIDQALPDLPGIGGGNGNGGDGGDDPGNFFRGLMDDDNNGGNDDDDDPGDFFRGLMGGNPNVNRNPIRNQPPPSPFDINETTDQYMQLFMNLTGIQPIGNDPNPIIDEYGSMYDRIGDDINLNQPLIRIGESPNIGSPPSLFGLIPGVSNRPNESNQPNIRQPTATPAIILNPETVSQMANSMDQRTLNMFPLNNNLQINQLREVKRSGYRIQARFDRRGGMELPTYTLELINRMGDIIYRKESVKLTRRENILEKHANLVLACTELWNVAYRDYMRNKDVDDLFMSSNNEDDEYPMIDLSNI